MLRLLALLALITQIAGFATPPAFKTTRAVVETVSPLSPLSPPTSLSGLFGLGAPEVAIIGVAAAFLLGPAKLSEFSKDLGKVAGELKEVPKEVRKGEGGGTGHMQLCAQGVHTQ